MQRASVDSPGKPTSARIRNSGFCCVMKCPGWLWSAMSSHGTFGYSCVHPGLPLADSTNTHTRPSQRFPESNADGVLSCCVTCIVCCRHLLLLLLSLLLLSLFVVVVTVVVVDVVVVATVDAAGTTVLSFAMQPMARRQRLCPLGTSLVCLR